MRTRFFGLYASCTLGVVLALSGCGDSASPDALKDSCVEALNAARGFSGDAAEACACVTQAIVSARGEKNLEWFIRYHEEIARSPQELSPLTTDVEVNNYLLLEQANTACRLKTAREPELGAR
ncbi:hypothetical protein IHV25_03355 [Phaeovibrio sulfidiphilus]|uniref:Lipoprotein n=1 Tax=Phaeovibrio sulfidiphilus TaxID=1220600 RepID=A0A8J6YUK0_9PROT|nr:hypothetical protein [Phaeovibrio sulfidiphilus]MBE1236689.1 hypothetical protein [Phaeovibrio sulfidiphilus]